MEEPPFVNPGVPGELKVPLQLRISGRLSIFFPEEILEHTFCVTGRTIQDLIDDEKGFDALAFDPRRVGFSIDS